eukprot:SAG22_NODE_13003_length_422_cov_0.634675_2_plen_52_part_01
MMFLCTNRTRRYRAAMVIGNVLYRFGKHADAEPYFREVLSLNPTHTGAMNNL